MEIDSRWLYFGAYKTNDIDSGISVDGCWILLGQLATQGENEEIMLQG